MKLIELRSELNLEADELAKLLGLSKSMIKNSGSKNIKELSKQFQASLKLLKENVKLKNENEVLKKLIKE